ncbi:sulfate transporter family-domain-containing protein [Catenaria anguillulae PL171]|uniref:Sulfate transporter family-domain-containing protein n=1 Tax=Catenaria anguillulae PL171 TaxID=765915 RepID=A0A1Y2HP99_9FUNG|nr:sulfate transporter family-domain-containing protein [Catenaria anguillulae PL171]
MTPSSPVIHADPSPPASSRLRAASALSSVANVLAQTPATAASYFISSLRFYRNNPFQLKTELLLGLAVSIMMVPESLAFAFTAGLSPVQGLQATVFIGLFAALFGGRPGTVSGMAGALVVIQKDLIIPYPGQNALAGKCMSERLEVLFATMCLVGVLQIVLGIVRAPKLVSLVPHTVMFGFANGLALVMGIAQLTAFKVDDEQLMSTAKTGVGEPANCPATETPIRNPQRWLMPTELQFYLVLLLMILSMLVMELQPRIRRTLTLGRLQITSKLIPATLTSMLLATLVEHVVFRTLLGVHTTTVGDVARLRGSTLTWPTSVPILPLSSPHWPLALQYALTLSAVGSLESVLTMDMCATLAHAPATQADGVRELVAQGLGNLVGSVFASAGGSALVGQSVLNIQSGARGRLSSVSASLWILAYVVFAGPAIELVPVASLSGILFVVILHMITWDKWWAICVRRNVPWKDSVTVVLVTGLSVYKDLAVAVGVGVVWSAVGYAWDAGRKVEVELGVEGGGQETIVVHPGTGQSVVARIVKVYGPLFFASTTQLERMLDPPSRSQLLFADVVPDSPPKSPLPVAAAAAPRYMLLDVSESVLHDYSAVVAVVESARKWADVGGGLLVTGLDGHGLRMLQRACGKVDCEVDDEPASERAVVWFPFGDPKELEATSGQVIPEASVVADSTSGHHVIPIADLDERETETRHRHVAQESGDRERLVAGDSSEADLTEHEVKAST